MRNEDTGISVGMTKGRGKTVDSTVIFAIIVALLLVGAMMMAE